MVPPVSLSLCLIWRYITDYACLLHGYIIVPLHPTSSLSNIIGVLNRAKPSIVVISTHLQDTFALAMVEAKKSGHQSVRSMILIEDWEGAYPDK